MEIGEKVICVKNHVAYKIEPYCFKGEEYTITGFCFVSDKKRIYVDRYVRSVPMEYFKTQEQLRKDKLQYIKRKIRRKKWNLVKNLKLVKKWFV